VRAAVADDALTTELMDAMLNARAALWKEYCRLHDLVVKFVAGHELCRRFMQIPGVGPVTALSFMTAIDDPTRFRRSRDVAAYFGLTSRRWQSGTSIDVQGRISKAGDGDVRRALYEAASALMTRFKRKDKVKTWGMMLVKRSCHRKAVVAVARKLAVIMHAMWIDGTFYNGDDRHALNMELRHWRMRTGADQGRRNARYLACGALARPRRIACDSAPSFRWKGAPRRLSRCQDAAILCRR
jgi:transposase